MQGEVLAQKITDPNLSRDVGRYAASSKASGAVRQYALGFMSPAAVYRMLEKIAPTMSRGATVKAKRLGPNKVEIVSTPKPGVEEKPYQCDNRMGTFEALSKLFTNKFAKIEHPSCFHKHGDSCRYIITWENTPSFGWKRVRNYFVLFSVLISLGFFLIFPVILFNNSK